MSRKSGLEQAQSGLFFAFSPEFLKQNRSSIPKAWWSNLV